tara:strand:- start:98 stop:565 length:468 start_codon:yes stop_codon:yes gene_type:complete
VKITKSRLKKIIKEEVMNLISESSNIAGKAAEGFYDAVKTIQDVLSDSNIGDAAGGTYDPLGEPDFEIYDDARERLEAHPDYREAVDMLMRRNIKTSDGGGDVVEVGVGVDDDPGYGPSSSEVYITLSDGSNLMIDDDKYSIEYLLSIVKEVNFI